MADIGAVPVPVDTGGNVIYGGGLINGYMWGAPIDFWIIRSEERRVGKEC